MSVGCDVVKIDRFAKWSDHWVLRWFGSEVYNQYIERNKQKEFLASRWALKEAVYKSCGKKENVINKKGIPKSKFCSVSVSHDGEYCFAIAVKKGKNNG